MTTKTGRTNVAIEMDYRDWSPFLVRRSESGERSCVVAAEGDDAGNR